ncbi:MAG: enoyl-CoA hydratase/isomerase family protein [Dehalococcoidia bacterium]|nr:enoyl-CoA hydratase/isomerase family protein [Dehalococcoidia bacterium]
MALTFERQGRIATITINRPKALNSLDPETLQELHQALAELRDDPELWVGVITGAGERAFCAGADLTATIPVMLDPKAVLPYRAPPTVLRGMELFKPLIAAVNGLALGGGLELVLACDLRLAAEGATFGQPEVKWSLIPGWGATQRLPRMMPYARAAEMILMGRAIDAQEALRLGLINAVVPREKLMETAAAWAAEICQLGPLGVRAAKEAMLRGLDQPLEQGLRLEQMLFEGLRYTEDCQEGPRAFAEKRTPVFKGR